MRKFGWMRREKGRVEKKNKLSSLASLRIEVRREMKGSGWKHTALLLLLMLPLVILVVVRTGSLPQAALFNDTRFTNLVDRIVHKVSSLGLDGARWPQKQEEEAVDATQSKAPQDHNQNNQILATSGTAGSSLVLSDVEPPVISQLNCNFSNYYANICEMEGAVRVHGKSSTVFVLSSSTYRPENSTVKIRPYARKWEKETMARVREITILSTPPGAAAGDFFVPPRCTARHDVPAVVFSTGACGMNFFHGMTDILVPLYITAREYGGHVQLLAADYNAQWLAKHRPILAALSAYPVIDLDSDTAVRCFPEARVGLASHRILGIDPALSRNGYTMMGFRDFLRSVFSLPRQWWTPVSRSSGSQKPRMVMVLRRKSRTLTNEADAIAAMTDLGFEVVAERPQDVRDTGRFAAVVNSCDVMVGVHGAGLTNMVFLPHNATIVQIVPWGKMKYSCRFDFGDPVPDMGLRYVEYEATAEETTLKEKYPRDHPVFTDPLSVHRKGDVWKTFLNGQNVTLDIERFKEAMLQVYQSVTTV